MGTQGRYYRVNLLLSVFPLLSHSSFNIESPVNKRYNCIAWAAEDTINYWWPVEKGYWPEGSPRALTLDAFVAAFATRGYSLCENEIYEDGFIKIAIFVRDDGTPTHAARQKPNGKWTSKCGKYKDIEHDLNALCGAHPAYGKIACYMKKPS